MMCVVDGDVLPGDVADVLPARNLFEGEKADLVAGVEEVTRLRVVRGAHDVAAAVVTKDFGALFLPTARHGLAHPEKCLVPVAAVEFHDFAVQQEALICEGRLAETEATAVFVDGFVVFKKLDMNCIEPGVLEVPQDAAGGVKRDAA